MDSDSTTQQACLVCGGRFDELSRTHIIPNAMGGRLKPRLACSKCNEWFGTEWDAPLTDQYEHITKLVNPPRDNGKHKPMQLQDDTGAEYSFTPDSGRLVLARPVKRMTPESGEKAYKIYAGSPKQLRQELLRLKHVEQEPIPDEVIQDLPELSTEKGPPVRTSFRYTYEPGVSFPAALVALWLFGQHMGAKGLAAWPTIQERIKAKSILEYCWVQEYEPWLNVHELNGPYHSIVLKSHRASQCLIGYLNYFGLITFGMLVQENYPYDVSAHYVYDLAERKDISGAVTLDTTGFELFAIDYDTRYHPAPPSSDERLAQHIHARGERLKLWLISRGIIAA